MNIPNHIDVNTKVLMLNYKNLTQLPDYVHNLVNLETLYCNYNNLTSLPDLPASLKLLHCNYNNLTSLPDLPASLEILHCHHNNLTSLPDLPASLEILHCHNNNLTVLPNLPHNLTDLICSNNMLTVLPELPVDLSIINCSNNKITFLPELPLNLKELNCNNNTLTILPELPSSLRTLEVDNNPFIQETIQVLDHWFNMDNRRLNTNNMDNNQWGDDEWNNEYNMDNMDNNEWNSWNTNNHNMNDGEPDTSEHNMDNGESNDTMDHVITNINITTPLSSSGPFVIHNNTKAQDIFGGGDVIIKTYIEEDHENLIFKIKDSYIASSKSIIQTVKYDNSAIFFECYNTSHTLMPVASNVNKNEPLFNLRKIGLFINYVKLSEINSILQGTNQVFVIELTDPVRKLVSVVSQTVYDTENVVSAAHCQEGQGDNLYVIKQGNYTFNASGGKRTTRKYNKKMYKPKKTKSKKNNIILKYNIKHKSLNKKIKKTKKNNINKNNKNNK
jgi:hypothetical protein